MRTYMCTNLYKSYFNLRKNEDKDLHFLEIYKNFISNTCIIPLFLINDLIINNIYDKREQKFSISYKLLINLSKGNFKKHINELLKKNNNGSIIIYPFINTTDISCFCIKHMNLKFKFNKNESVNMFYDSNFNICVMINTNLKSKYSLSTELYYKFNKLINLKNITENIVPFIVGEENRQTLFSIIPNKNFKKDMLYIKNGIALNIWLEYLKDYLCYYNYKLEDILNIVKDKKSLKKELNKYKYVYWKRDILIFVTLLYFSNLKLCSFI